MDSHKSSLLEQKATNNDHKQNRGSSHSRHKQNSYNNFNNNMFVCIVNVISIIMMNLSRQLTIVGGISVESQNQHYQSHLATQTTHHHDSNNRNELEQQTKSDNSYSTTDNLGQTNALMYLQRYGYISSPSSSSSSLTRDSLHSTEAILNNNLISEESFEDAIKSFQKFAGIPQTGVVDEETQKFMQMPRCGNTDKQQATFAYLAPTNKALGKQQVVSNSQQQQYNITKFGGSILNSVRRRKRYALQGSKWRRQELTYRISQYPNRFNGKRHEVDAQIEKAFGIWSNVAPINFVVKRLGRVHIDIRFASGDHGDGDAFDGPGNTLAHAYFPQYGGDAHFDDQEYWTIDSYAGTNIFQVAAHELGHSLGLGHSNVREALMAPFYQKYKPNFKLHIDDILAIQALYGEKPIFLATDVPQQTNTFEQSTTAATSTSTTTTSTTTQQPIVLKTSTTTMKPSSLFPGGANQPPMSRNDFPAGGGGQNHENGIDVTHTNKPAFYPSSGDDGNELSPDNGRNHNNDNNIDLCTDSMIDAITRTEDGSSYVFKGDSYWLLTSDGLAKGYPRKIYKDWEGLPSNLDAALTWADGKTFFFKGNKYWRFRNRRRDVGYPKLISAGFAGIPNDIDAAFVWSGNGRTYIFKGTEYWRFDSKADPPVSSEYPRSIKVWNGVPSYINAAFKWENNVTYFFKGQQYYRFNDKEFKIESRGRPPFPRGSAEWWFGCVGSNSLAAQRVASSSSLSQFKVDNLVTIDNNREQQQQIKPSESNLNDWSYFTGFDETQNNIAKISGTHISDHETKPPQMTPPSPGVNKADNNNDEEVDENRIFYHRIGGINNLFEKQLPRSSSSSSSLSAINNNNFILISCLITTTTLVLMLKMRRLHLLTASQYHI